MREVATTLAAEMTPEELTLLHGTISGLSCEHGVLEIGTGAGGSLTEILRALESSGQSTAVTTIDPMTYFPNQFEIVKANLKARGFEPEQVRFHISNSKDVLRASRAANEKFDFILIDGNHKFRHVVMDLGWSDLLAPGGKIALHDHAPKFPGVRKAVAGFLRRNPYYQKVGQAGSLLVLERDLAQRNRWKRRETSWWHVFIANLLTPISQVLQRFGMDFLELV